MTQSPVSPNNSSNLEQWQPYELDHHAQELVLKNRDKKDRDKKDVLNETHKMRMTVAYGLERFWGERFRLEKESTDKANYWKDVWSVTVKILQSSGITLPNDNITANNDTIGIGQMADKLWKMDSEDRQISLMVLTQFCDSLVWWSQRLKTKNNEN
jgi:ATP-dependent helicase/DNAse subunit B